MYYTSEENADINWNQNVKSHLPKMIRTFPPMPIWHTKSPWGLWPSSLLCQEADLKTQWYSICLFALGPVTSSLELPKTMFLVSQIQNHLTCDQARSGCATCSLSTWETEAGGLFEPRYSQLTGITQQSQTEPSSLSKPACGAPFRTMAQEQEEPSHDGTALRRQRQAHLCVFKAQQDKCWASVSKTNK